MVVASLIDSLSKVGAITGIISFVGVGLMILIVAGQSRQIRAMREWIDAEPERQAEAAQRVIAEVQRRIAAARERRAAQVAGQPAPPAPASPARPPAPGTLGATPEAKAVAAAKAGDTVSAPEAAGSVPPPAAGDAPVFAPLTPAADAEAADDTVAPDVVAPAEELLSDPVNLGQETQPADALPASYDPLAAATPAAQAADPRFADDHFSIGDAYLDEEEEPRGNRLLFGAGIASLVAGVVLAGVLVFGGGGDEPSTASRDTGASTPSQQDGGTGGDDAGDAGSADGSGEVDPASVRVMVLNGTQVTGLAQRITDRLGGSGYSTSQPNTFTSDQPLTSTVVQYRAGHAAEARQVAKDLGLQSSAAQPITALVGQASPETANVVVVTGQDLASSASDGTTG